MSREELVAALRARTVRTLPHDWKKDRKCPQCNADAARPKCMWDMGGGGGHDRGEDPVSLSPQVATFAKALEDAAGAAMRDGMDAADMFGVLASFVGYAMGNHPANDRNKLVEATQAFAHDVLLHALRRRAEIVGAEVVS